MAAEHLFLQADDSESELREELIKAFPGARIAQTSSGLLQVGAEMSLIQRLPYLVFSRQFLPFARTIQAESIRILLEATGWEARLIRSRSLLEINGDGLTARRDTENLQHAVGHDEMSGGIRMNAVGHGKLGVGGPGAIVDLVHQLVEIGHRKILLGGQLQDFVRQDAQSTVVVRDRRQVRGDILIHHAWCQ